MSIIVPTRNNEHVIAACLQSLQLQTYSAIEVIVVDGNSTDTTQSIAREKGARVIIFPQKGDHRSAQRNLGFHEARGMYLMYIDSDMVLMPEVVAECVAHYEGIDAHRRPGALTIHEKSVGHNFWAHCKAMERMCYWGDPQIEGVRFFAADLIKEIGGFDEDLIAAEDWDLCERIKEAGYIIDAIDAYILHDEGNINLWSLWKKKAYYGSHMPQFVHSSSHNTTSGGFWYAFSRLYIFRPSLWRQWRTFVRHPLVAGGMIIMLTGEIIAGGVGYLYGMVAHKKS